VGSREEVDQVMGEARGAGAGHFLGRLRRLLPGPGRAPVGSRVQPGIAAGRRLSATPDPALRYHVTTFQALAWTRAGAAPRMPSCAP
jgi:hypothetical protein